jgi:NADH:ubiquinone oxidoreductase subunit 3 (subunit A)
MSPAIASSLGIVAYLALFAAVGIVFLFVNLLVGKFLRPHDPHPEKLEIYECGEPTIGSSFVQFDLRFYVVALLFIIFDVEVAFFFPWAAVFGKSNNLADWPTATSPSSSGPRAALSSSRLPPARCIKRWASAIRPRPRAFPPHWPREFLPATISPAPRPRSTPALANSPWSRSSI